MLWAQSSCPAMGGQNSKAANLALFSLASSCLFVWFCSS
jgi:hypothetical protein